MVQPLPGKRGAAPWSTVQAVFIAIHSTLTSQSVQPSNHDEGSRFWGWAFGVRAESLGVGAQSITVRGSLSWGLGLGHHNMGVGLGVYGITTHCLALLPPAEASDSPAGRRNFASARIVSEKIGPAPKQTSEAHVAHVSWSLKT